MQATHRRSAHLVLALLLGGIVLAAPSRQDPPPGATRALALVVHPDNPLRDVKLAHALGYLRLAIQYWPESRTRVTLVLPPPESAAKQTLNQHVYHMDNKRLKKHWRERVFSGEIPTAPEEAKTLERQHRMVAAAPGALSVLVADEVPQGLRALRVDGLAPGEEGYPLDFAPESAPTALSAARPDPR